MKKLALSVPLLETEVITIPVIFQIICRQKQQNIADAALSNEVEEINRNFQKLNSDTAVTCPAYFKQPHGLVRAAIRHLAISHSTPVHLDSYYVSEIYGLRRLQGDFYRGDKQVNARQRCALTH